MFFLFPEMKLFFSECFCYLPKLTGFFRKSAKIQCARWAEKNTCFFGNARPKSNARAHIKQREKHSGLKRISGIFDSIFDNPFCITFYSVYVFLKKKYTKFEVFT